MAYGLGFWGLLGHWGLRLLGLRMGILRVWGWVRLGVLGFGAFVILGWNHGPLVRALKPGIVIYLIYTRLVPFKVPSKG